MLTFPLTFVPAAEMIENIASISFCSSNGLGYEPILDDTERSQTSEASIVLVAARRLLIILACIAVSITIPCFATVSSRFTSVDLRCG